MSFLKIACLILATLLKGCAATVKRQAGSDEKLNIAAASTKKIIMVVKGSEKASNSDDWELLREQWRGAMAVATSTAGIAYKFQDADAPTTSERGTLVILKVNDYRYISQGARYALGIFMGNAYIDANVDFFELPDRRPAGSRKYDTSSSV